MRKRPRKPGRGGDADRDCPRQPPSVLLVATNFTIVAASAWGMGGCPALSVGASRGRHALKLYASLRQNYSVFVTRERRQTSRVFDVSSWRQCTSKSTTGLSSVHMHVRTRTGLTSIWAKVTPHLGHRLAQRGDGGELTGGSGSAGARLGGGRLQDWTLDSQGH